MRTLSREFLSMTTSTLSVSWFDGINPPCAVCSVNLLERMLLWRTIWRNKHSCARIKTFAAFAVKHASQHGFIESLYNCFREDARRRKELVGIDEEQIQRQQDPQVADPGLRHDLMRALNLLPLNERSAVLLCCQNGLSHDEAARVLDIPLGTVKTNVLRGREKLKRMLADWGPN